MNQAKLVPITPKQVPGLVRLQEILVLAHALVEKVIDEELSKVDRVRHMIVGNELLELRRLRDGSP